MIALVLRSLQSGASGFLAGAGVALALSALILRVCCRWFIFAKTGEPGWKALIPFYSDYLWFDIAWDGQLYLIMMVGSLLSIPLCGLIGLFDLEAGYALACVPGFAIAGMAVVTGVILPFRYAHAFGKSDAFAVGLWLLQPVFLVLLAFGDSQYQGATEDSAPPHDPTHWRVPPRPRQTEQLSVSPPWE